MKNYFIEIKVNLPYPLTKDYTLSATSAGTAIGRAIRLYRKDIGKKRIRSLYVKCELLAGIKQAKPNNDIKPQESKSIKSISDFSIGLDF